MLKHRVIPALLLRNGGLYKTVKFRHAKYVGDPINAIRIFNDKEVDELMVLDILASKVGAPPDFDQITRLAGECFMPLAYGGGVSSVDQAARIFSLGVEKVVVQTAALRDPGLVSRLAERFGSQSVVVSLDVKRDWLRRPRLYVASQQRNHEQSWLEVLELLLAAGAGEVLLNAVDRDGTLDGPDVNLIHAACVRSAVPVIALGGVGSLEDIRRAIAAGASAVAAGAFFVFHGPHRAVLITYPEYAQLESLEHPQV